MQVIALTDFYKTDHRRQYPPGTGKVYSNLTPRGSRILGIDEVVVFGVQYFLKEYLINRFNREFFNRPKSSVLANYKRRLDTALGKDAVPVDHIAALHELGYLPLHIKAMPEGMRCPLRVPCMTFWNTDARFFWLTNFLETLLSCTVWGPMTSATIAQAYRKLLDKYAAETSDMPAFVDWQGHDFSMRGMYGLEAALMSGAAHLLSFTGTDTVPAIDFLEEYYNADAAKDLIGGSVPATEHSVMCMGGSDNEYETIKRLLTEVYPKGVVSVVSDTWDYWHIVDHVLPRLKDIIMKRDGKLVIRPDSGDPVMMVCETVPKLYDHFGGTVNSKGYRQLDPHIGIIYGDSITLERCQSICAGLKSNWYASTNMVLGIGSYTYQYNTRDTFGFAVKSTYGEINGKPVSIFKDPKTDDGVKKSARGLLAVTEDRKLVEGVGWAKEGGLLRTVFLNGKLLVDDSLAQIRARLKDAS